MKNEIWKNFKLFQCSEQIDKIFGKIPISVVILFFFVFWKSLGKLSGSNSKSLKLEVLTRRNEKFKTKKKVFYFVFGGGEGGETSFSSKLFKRKKRILNKQKHPI